MPESACRCPFCMRILPEGAKDCPFCGRHLDLSGQDERALPAGTVLAARYILGALAGTGGSGFLYVAWDLHLSARIAVKEAFPKETAERGTDGRVFLRDGEDHGNRQLRESFASEAACMTALRGTGGVPQVLDLFGENGTYYIAMTFEEGIPLSEEIALRGGKIRPGEAARLLLPVSDTLIQLHLQGWIHRDLSPDNLLVLNDGRTVLVDLGAGEDLYSRGRGIWSVSSGFSPYEQYQRDGRTGFWTDIYAMGALLFYCIYGEVPPSAAERKNGRDLYADADPRYWKADRIIRKAMSMEPASRYGSMRDLREDLRKLRRADIPAGKSLTAAAVLTAAVCVLCAHAAVPAAESADMRQETAVSILEEKREGEAVAGLTGTYTVRACSDGALVWAVSQDPAEDAHALIVWTQVWDETQIFRLEEIREGHYRILAECGGRTCALTFRREEGSLQFTVPEQREEQTFRVICGGENTVLLQTCTEEVIGLRGDAQDSGQRAQIHAGTRLEAAPYDTFESTEAVHWILE